MGDGQEMTDEPKTDEQVAADLRNIVQGVNNVLNVETWTTDDQVVFNRVQVANNRSTQIALLSILAEVDKVLRYLAASTDSTLPPVGDGGVTLN